MRKPRVLDLFCGVGGASMGLHLAGCEVFGIDIRPQPEYPFTFCEEDALQLPPELLLLFDLVWASPPCQCYSSASGMSREAKRQRYPDLVAATRKLLEQSGRPYVIENVPSAPIRKDLQLCGTMFGLKILRHRNFEIKGFAVPKLLHYYHHKIPAIQVRGFGTVAGNGGKAGVCSISFWQKNMGITWTKKRKSIAEAVPVAYSRHIGEAFVAAFKEGHVAEPLCLEARPAFARTNEKPPEGGGVYENGKNSRF